MIIGVFDSGVGGLSVAQALEGAFPQHKILFRNDAEHVPYGNKSADELYALAMPILQELAVGVDVIVLACNTLSTVLLPQIRAALPITVLGVEPVLTEAAQRTRSQIVAVFATPATLASDRYAQLKQQTAEQCRVIEPDCSTWAAMIESNAIDRKAILRVVDDVCEHGADTIVLGCTHYHWIRELINHQAGGRAVVLSPEPSLIATVAAMTEPQQ